jgi:beta-N-acetylhexosaminidase
LTDAKTLKAGFRESNPLPVIFGVSSTILSDEEKSFFENNKPFGFIVFQRNCENPEQLSKLVKSMRASVGWHCPVLIDQEGGRVRRMKEPNWPHHQSSRAIGDQGQKAVIEQAEFLAKLLFDVGIDVNCLPVCDVPYDERTDNVVGDRAYSDDPKIVAEYTQAFIARSAELGMSCTLKHMPGHGRGRVDSHKELPVVNTDLEALKKTDFLPFTQAIQKMPDMPYWGMVAHILFTAIDHELPSSLSPAILQGLIRDGWGYQDHLLVTDDINMGALSKFGDVHDIAVKSLDAGIDIVLHCNGVFDEMLKIAKTIPDMRDDTKARINRWLDVRSTQITYSIL